MGDRRLTIQHDVFVVRHGAAGDRQRWKGPDEPRPLTATGRRQADGLPLALEPHGVSSVTSVRSSDSVRCRQTVAPLALGLGLSVDDEARLCEGTPLPVVLGLIAECGSAVLCTHGDVVSDLVLHLDARGLLRDPPVWPKGSTWVLSVTGGAVTAARYVGLPA